MAEILNEGLPKQDPEILVNQLRQELDEGSTREDFFPADKDMRYRQNFDLFDRDFDNKINFEELKLLLRSVGEVFDDEELEQLYNVLLKKTEEDQEEKNGITYLDFQVIVFKKRKDQDKKAQLSMAFKIFDEDGAGMINAENFKEFLMTLGKRYNEADADAFLKIVDPKGEGSFNYEQFIRKMIDGK